MTPDLLRAWKVQLAARRTPSTVHKYLCRLSCVFQAAVDEYGWLAENPLRRVRRPSPGRGSVRFLTADERQRLLAACQASHCPLLYAIVVLALATGGRRTEVRTLQWAQVDLEAGVVRFVQTKTDLDRSVPLVGEARTLLQHLAATRVPGVPWVFPSPDGQRPRQMHEAWRRGGSGPGSRSFASTICGIRSPRTWR